MIEVLLSMLLENIETIDNLIGYKKCLKNVAQDR